MIILNENDSQSLKSESLKSESTTSLYLLEPPQHRRSLSSGPYSANSSQISINTRTATSTPLPSSPPRSTRPLRNLSQPATPPGYLESKRPATAITYTFQPQNIPSNSMILSAPSYTAAPQEPYYISVNMNCFTPTSYITTILRGSWDGETIADFEMGLSGSRSQFTVLTRGKEYSLGDLLDSSYKIVKTVWSWKVMDTERTVIYWDDASSNTSSNMLMCYSSRDKLQGHLLAKFIHPPTPSKLGKAPELTRLEVQPLGHDFIDDIVLSALIIERLRTMPTIARVPLT